jgi:hypothetical protein
MQLYTPPPPRIHQPTLRDLEKLRTMGWGPPASAGGAGWRSNQRGGGWGPITNGPLYPASAAEHLAVTGKTVEGLYLMTETSGAIANAVDGTTLALNGSPDFNGTVGTRKAIFYDSNAERHAGDYHDFALDSFMMSAACYVTSTGSALGICGRNNNIAPFNESALIYLQIPASGFVGCVLRDAAAGQVIASVGVNVYDAPFLVTLQVDRTAQVARMYVSVNGVGTLSSTTPSLATFGTFTPTSASAFQIGATTSLNGGGVRVGWVAVMRGAQCEGASAMPNYHAALNWE